MTTYGKRTGWTRFVYLLNLLCALYRVFAPTIDAWAESKLSPTDFATFKSFTGLIGTVCVMSKSIPDD